MKSLRDHLREGDPVALETPLSTSDSQRLRRAVLAAVASRPSPASFRRRAWALAGVLAIAAAVAGANRWAHSSHVSQAPSSEARVESPARQLQFSTPGGTRVIWVFNPDLP